MNIGHIPAKVRIPVFSRPDRVDFRLLARFPDLHNPAPDLTLRRGQDFIPVRVLLDLRLNVLRRFNRVIL